jgi:hypothetical protein
VALTTGLLAVLLFIVAASRGRRSARRRLERHVAAPYVGVDARSAGLTRQLSDRATAAANQALDQAADIVRKGRRESILATLAVTAVIGIVIGRLR